MSKKAIPFPSYERNISTQEAPSGFFSLYYSDVPKKAQIRTHFHHTIEVMLVLSGTVSVSVEGELFPMREGDISIVQPGRMHRTLIHTPDKQYIRYVLHLNPSFVKDFIGRQGLDAADFEYLFRCCVLHCSRETTLFASSLLERLHTIEYENTGQTLSGNVLFGGQPRQAPVPGSVVTNYDVLTIQTHTEDGRHVLPQYIYARCLVEELLLYFAMYNSQVRQQTIPVTNPLVEKTIQYLNENYRDPDLSLQEIAQAMFVSQGYLCRTFKKYSGGSLYNYVIQKRLACAQTLLQNGAAVLDACLQSGFRDYSSFLKAFRAAYAVTPREYVARCRATAGREH